MTQLSIPIHDPDYTLAYILLFLSILCFIITYKLWKKEENEKRPDRFYIDVEGNNERDDIR